MAMNASKWIKQLITEGLQQLEHSYGVHGIHPLAYHNLEHATDVMSATRAMTVLAINTGKITFEQAELLMLAACYHDLIHDESGENEAASAKRLTDRMRETGEFTDKDYDFVTRAILATRFTRKGDKIVQAGGDSLEEQLMADADLASLGRRFDVFWDRAQKLRQEEERAEPQQDYIRAELAFLRGHKFFTDEAEQAFPHSASNIEQVESLLAS
jgi:predicted metal-dependent HD superfamily phosphohydrolase